jgi:hypothetical protein
MATETKATETKSNQLGKSELKRLISERLRNKKTNNTHFVKLAELLITLKGKRPLVADEPPTAKKSEPAAESDLDELVRKLEAKQKEQ